MNYKHTNALIKESSPYLLQHAHNPVNWVAWSDDVLAKAKKENKPLLISIGYAACHWCHVMEEETFENPEVAKIMNKHFINIKVDREERPDIDQIYMDALQMMTGRGGWPLNIVALPGGEPFWGTTYLKKDDWMQVLTDLNTLYLKDPSKVRTYANNLVEGINGINLIEPREEGDTPSINNLREMVSEWYTFFDLEYGGYKRAPKFMMPANLDFLLHYGVSMQDDTILNFVHLSLTKIAYGGVYDHLAGGFSRYSVDDKWHVPHFEKMLYDNAQLISVYSKAFGLSKKTHYKEVVEETINFLTRDLMSPDFSFYSSLDADSLNKKNELEEGAYYVWTRKELTEQLGERFTLFEKVYNINDFGLWEDNNYVLIRDKSLEQIAVENNLSISDLKVVLSSCKKDLLKLRSSRNAPRLDDKILCSWNGLMLRALTDAYRYLGQKEYLSLAIGNAKFINKHFIKEDGSMYHGHKNGQSSINGFLEDYASVIDGFLGLYETSLEEAWLVKAKKLTIYCLKHFHDSRSELFFFTSDKDAALIRRTKELTDNVISSSNSIMAKNLFKLSKYYPKDIFYELSKKMLRNIAPELTKNISNYANWAHQILFHEKPFYELAIVGPNYKEQSRQIQEKYLPNCVFAATAKESTIDILQNRAVKDKTLLYLCEFGTCQLPTEEAEVVLSKLL